MPELDVASAVPVRPQDGAQPLLRVEALVKHFAPSRRWRPSRQAAEPIRAVDGVSFTVARGETFGIVGESGSGKTTVARCLVRLAKATSGSMLLDGVAIEQLERDALRRARRRMQLVFQDPYASLDPRMTVRALVREPLELHRKELGRIDAGAVLEALEMVGITDAQADRKPHAFSGGQRQRVAIARALVLRPDLVILDEPVSALDVSIQAQILNLLTRLQQELGLAFVLIVHDLAVAEHACHRLAVMYRGRIVETGSREELFRRPLHPYTVALLDAVPVPDPATRPPAAAVDETSAKAESAEDAPAGEATPHRGAGDGRGALAPLGCRYRPRCPVGRDREICRLHDPALTVQAGGHAAACHFPGEAQSAAREQTLATKGA
jgi:ABC-type oligopeptide transport system ATPase subunit